MSGITPALVVVVPSRLDWQRVCAESWYRIPLRYAPQPVAAEYLAFYLTRRCGALAWSVPAFAPVLRYSVLERRQIMAQPDHPRAAELYYRIAVGPLEWLPRPLRSRRLRRITFIPTTLETLRAADDVADLWHTDEAAALAAAHFPDAARKATQRLAIEEARARYTAAGTKMLTSAREVSIGGFAVPRRARPFSSRGKPVNS